MAITKPSEPQDIDLIYILDNVCPGQTLQSIKNFIQKHLKLDCWKNPKLEDLPFYEVCLQRKNISGNFKSGKWKPFDDTSHPRTIKSLERAKEILSIYDKMKK